MRQLAKIAAGAGAMMAATVSQASAEICLLGICIGGGGGGGGGGTPVAPEIDAGQGLAALLVFACIALMLRERFLRQRR